MSLIKFILVAQFLLIIFLLLFFVTVWMYNVELIYDNVLISDLYFQRESYLINACSLDYNKVLTLEREKDLQRIYSTLEKQIYGASRYDSKLLIDWKLASDQKLRDYNLL